MPGIYCDACLSQESWPVLLPRVLEDKSPPQTILSSFSYFGVKQYLGAEHVLPESKRGLYVRGKDVSVLKVYSHNSPL